MKTNLFLLPLVTCHGVGDFCVLTSECQDQADMCCGSANFNNGEITTTVCNQVYRNDVTVNGTVFNNFQCLNTEMLGNSCVDAFDCSAENFCCGDAFRVDVPPKRVCGTTDIATIELN